MPTNNSDARERALEAAQTIMDRSSYCIWPADAKQNIADGLIAFSPRTESVPAADLLSIVSEWRVVLENTGSITLRDNDHSNLVDIAAILALRATLPADEQAAAPRSEGDWVTVPRAVLQEVSDLLAERIYGNPARSAGHNARVKLDSILAALTPDAGQVEAERSIPDTPFTRQRYLKEVPPVEGGGATRRHWIIVHEPNRIPEKKGPFKQERITSFLQELIDCRPAKTKLTVISLTWDFDIWVEDGHCHLIEQSALDEYYARSPASPDAQEAGK